MMELMKSFVYCLFIYPAGDGDLPLILLVLYTTAACLTYSLFEIILIGAFDHSKPLPLLFRKLVTLFDSYSC